MLALLWDFGGVLTTSPFESFNRYEAAHGLPRDFIRTINATNPQANAWAQFESNQISVDEFDRLFREESEAAGYAVQGRDVVALIGGEIRPRMVAALRICKQHYKMGCITNNFDVADEEQGRSDSEREQEYADVWKMFNVVVESRIEGIRKPDPRIYELACERLGVAPADCAFFDDLGVNLKPARALGMTTIKVLHEDQALADLSKLTGLSFPSV